MATEKTHVESAPPAPSIYKGHTRSLCALASFCLFFTNSLLRHASPWPASPSPRGTSKRALRNANAHAHHQLIHSVCPLLSFNCFSVSLVSNEWNGWRQSPSKYPSHVEFLGNVKRKLERERDAEGGKKNICMLLPLNLRLRHRLFVAGREHLYLG